MRRRLVLFDIDGTLISDGGAGARAFAAALAATYDFAGDIYRYDFSGRTDPQLAYMILGDAGYDEASIDARMPQLWQLYLAGLARHAASGTLRILPGITSLLAALRRHEHLTLALLTGNIEPGARIKLASAGLNDYFPFGAFGSDSQHRQELPPIAVARASTLSGHQFDPADVVIIGDSIYDVRCGVPHNATTIAVASGRTPAATLRAENPHYLFQSAEDASLLAAILGTIEASPES